MSDLRTRLNSIHVLAREVLKQKLQTTKEYYDKGILAREYRPGDIVYRRNKATKKGLAAKFLPKWEGPWVILEPLSEYTYRCRNRKRVAVLHHDSMKPSNDLEKPLWLIQLQREILDGEEQDIGPSASQTPLPEHLAEEQDITHQLRDTVFDQWSNPEEHRTPAIQESQSVALRASLGPQDFNLDQSTDLYDQSKVAEGQNHANDQAPLTDSTCSDHAQFSGSTIIYTQPKHAQRDNQYSGTTEIYAIPPKNTQNTSQQLPKISQVRHIAGNLEKGILTTRSVANKDCNTVSPRTNTVVKPHSIATKTQCQPDTSCQPQCQLETQCQLDTGEHLCEHSRAQSSRQLFKALFQ